jgi:transposase
MRTRQWPVDQVYVYLPPVDFRKSINGLSALVELELELDPFMPALFVFVNRQRDKVKVLLEKQRFCWPVTTTNQVRELSPQLLSWLLDGVDIDRVRPHHSLHFGAQLNSI